MRFQTVTGLVPIEAVRLADGHGHVWIDPPKGVAVETRLELNDPAVIAAELQDFASAGGTTLVDCQPFGCGRDARKLIALAAASGLHITATTGFHQAKYYPPSSWVWSASAAHAADFFIEELTQGMREAPDAVATTIKVGYEGRIEGQTRLLMEAAAHASRQTGALILFHTERGANVEALLPFFEQYAVPPQRLYFCHMDKRPDLGLHRELARAGVLLGYDTFVRPQYGEAVWRLLKAMVDDGLSGSIAIGLDLAAAAMWQRYGGQLGMLALPQQIVPRLRQEGIGEQEIRQLTGQNIAQRLVKL